MLKGFGGGKFAIGMIVGIALYFLFGAILDVTNPPVNNAVQYVANSEGSNQPTQHNPEAGEEQSPWFWHWSGHWIESGDTLAQWVMMVFTVAAAGFLLWTLFETRRIGQAQTRAYLDISKIELTKVFANNPSVKIKIRNTGQSPAKMATVKFRLTVQKAMIRTEKGWSLAPKIYSTDFSQEIPVMDIPAGYHDYIGNLIGQFGDNDFITHFWCAEDCFATVDVSLQGVDVFDQIISARARFVAYSKDADFDDESVTNFHRAPIKRADQGKHE